MKGITVLGTGSADGWPNPFCRCAPCESERAVGRVRHVLLTHQHPDHCSPAFLLFRSWLGDAPLDVVGPAGVVDVPRTWVAPGSPVNFVPVAGRVLPSGMKAPVSGGRVGR